VNIKVYTNSSGNYDLYEDITRLKVGSSYDRVLHLYRGKELIAIYNSSSWTKTVKAGEADEHDNRVLRAM
jgi:hypothetical protein